MGLQLGADRFAREADLVDRHLRRSAARAQSLDAFVMRVVARLRYKARERIEIGIPPLQLGSHSGGVLGIRAH